MEETIKKIVRETTPIELLAVTGGIFAGLLFASLTNVIAKVPGLLFVIPASLNMRGGIFASLGARTSTKLHLGLIKPSYVPSGVLLVDIFAYLTLNIIWVVIQVILAYLFSLLIGMVINFLLLLFILSLSVIISASIMFPVTVFCDLFFFRKGFDPENVIGPILTSTSDVVSFLSIILSAIILGV
jgi:mgtE-like transporter